MTCIPSVRPYFEDTMDARAALRQALNANPASMRALAREAGVSPKLLRMLRDGERRLTPDVQVKLVDALRRWEADVGDAANALEAADLELGGNDG